MTPYVERERERDERDERDERRPLKECPNRLDPLAKVVWHVPKPIRSLFSTLYVERERDEHDEHRPLKECPNRLDPLAWDLAECPKGPKKGARRAPCPLQVLERGARSAPNF